MYTRYSHFNPLYWGGLYGTDWVEVSRSPNNPLVLDIDIDLKIKKSFFWGLIIYDTDIDIDFDLRIACHSGTLHNVTINLGTVEVRFIQGVVDKILAFFVNLFSDVILDAADSIAKVVVEKIKPIQFSVPINNIFMTMQTRCPKVTVSPEGDIEINFDKFLYEE